MQVNILASGSSGNAYLINNGATTLLLDAGISFRDIQKGCGFNTRAIAGCLITHSHKDHSKSANDLIKRGIDVYTSNGTISACGLTGHRVHAMKDRQTADIGTFRVLAFDVQHDAPEPLGFMAVSSVTKEKLLYFTDTYYLKYSFSGLTHILGECNYDRQSLEEAVKDGRTPPELGARLMKSHMSLEHFTDFLNSCDISQVRQIYLLHLSRNNSNAEYMKRTIQAITGTEVYIC